MISIDSHVKEIEQVAAGRESRREAAVVQSWRRCIHEHALDPTRPKDAYIVPEFRLREHQEQAEALIRLSRSHLARLFDQVAEDDYVLLLSDARGVAVDYMGDRRLQRSLQRAGLYLGAEWSERRAGTCAIGACLMSGEPVTIHQDDHFDATHTPLTCTAAPIFDTLGELVAVLDISQLRSPTAKSSQRLAMHLVQATCRRIEMANLLVRSGGDWVLRLARSPEFVDIDPDAALSIDAAGHISGMTRGGYAALAGVAGRRPAPETFIGAPIGDFFDLSVDTLDRYMRSQPAGERLVHARGEPALFASAISPAPRVGTARRPKRSTARLAEPLQRLSRGDEAMSAVAASAARLAARDIAILIQGETGSGKERLARAVHDSCERAGRFIAVNCAAIPEHLIESELFGHVPNAFTGAARKGKTGLIRAADGGTLFLDEIGDMPLALQTRLLRVLSENEVTPVGGLEPQPVSLHVISATHQALDTLVAQGRFREDLYYRLNAATLRLPALRERDDLAWLIADIVAELGATYGMRYELAEDASRLLHRYAWPGNLRELRNALKVACALCSHGVVRGADLPAPLRAQSAADSSLQRQLADCGGNVSALARRLGVNRSTVHRRLKRERDAPSSA